MLDVHPPHAPTHTWRDFLIHIATICVGLLIAIGLEQAVEAIHHHHQRIELEAQLRNEAQRNLDLVQQNIDRLQAQLAWYNANIVALNRAPVSNGRISSAHLVPPGDIFRIGLLDPSQATWAVAKANGSVALLPEDEAQVYSRLDHEAELLQQPQAELLHSRLELQSLRQSRSGLPPSQLAYLTLDRRDALLHALAAIYSDSNILVVLELNEAGACRGVLHNARTVDEMIQYMIQEVEQYDAHHPQNPIPGSSNSKQLPKT
jgi:prefoldin subunit 5